MTENIHQKQIRKVISEASTTFGGDTNGNGFVKGMALGLVFALYPNDDDLHIEVANQFFDVPDSRDTSFGVKVGRLMARCSSLLEIPPVSEVPHV